MIYGILGLLVLLLLAPGMIIGLKHRPVLPGKEPGKRYLACVGDSITFGSGVIAHRKTQSYPAILQTLIPGNWQVLNYGFSGKTLLRSGDMPYEKSGFLRDVIATRPEILLLMLGTNDSKPYNWDAEAYAREYRELIGKIREELPETRVYVMLPPAAFVMEGKRQVVYDIRAEVIEGEVCPILREMGEELSVPLIDLHTLTREHPEYFADGVHPNGEGNRHIAEKIAATLELGKET